VRATDALRDAVRTRFDDVFELFPYGVFVAARNGRIVAANARARRLIDESDQARAEDASCCSLLGCRRPGSPLEKICLTETAVVAGKRLPEFRVDVPNSPTGALWVTAAPLYDDGSRVVFQLRPGSPGDRRARTRLHWAAGPQLRIYALGELRLEGREGPITGEWLEQRSGQLLKYLVCERHRVVPTEMIAEALWPNSKPTTLNTVRHFVHALRARIEPDRPKRGPGSIIVARHGGYVLNHENVWLDVDEFEHQVRTGLAALATGEDARAIERFEQALALYAGDFLADEPYAEWAFAERERLRSLVEKPLRALAELRVDDPSAQVAYRERLAEMDPFDSDAQRQLIATLVRVGKRSRAARLYHAFRLRLMREFNEQPDFELTEL
jgi:DNA-binding SARP family transcriptional activator